MASHLPSGDIAQVVQSLAEQVRRIETVRRPAGDAVVSSGSPPLDRLLPAGGFRRGTLVEWLSSGSGSGAATLALWIAAQAARDGGTVVVVDHQRGFYPPAAVPLGIELAQLIVVRPASPEDQAWAVDQLLRWRGVAAVWCWPQVDDDHTLRRWQLAAEASGVLGLLLRPERARHESSWAELRLAVEPLAEPERPLSAPRARRLRIELVRSRGGRAGQTVEIEFPPRREQALPGTGFKTVGDCPNFPAGTVRRMVGEENGTVPLAQTCFETSSSELATGLRSTPHETRAMHLAPPLAAAKTRRRSRRA